MHNTSIMIQYYCQLASVALFFRNMKYLVAAMNSSSTDNVSPFVSPSKYPSILFYPCQYVAFFVAQVVSWFVPGLSEFLKMFNSFPH